jgi:hypothetical protein
MTDTPFDRAPGNGAAPTEVKEGTQSGAGLSTIGSVLAVILTATSCWVWLFTVYSLIGARP